MPQRFEHQRVEQGSQSTARESSVDEQGSERIRRGSAKESDDEALDAVLDDIETTLEGNAQEYVSSFVQQGGE